MVYVPLDVHFTMEMTGTGHRTNRCWIRAEKPSSSAENETIHVIREKRGRARLQGETDKEIMLYRGESLVIPFKRCVYEMALPFGSNRDQNNSASGCTFENREARAQERARRRGASRRFASRGIYKPQPPGLSGPLRVSEMYQVSFQVLYLFRKMA